MTFGQLAKYTSAMYSELPPQEKEAWIARAEADKARYLHELASYVPPPGYDAKGDAIVASPAVSSSMFHDSALEWRARVPSSIDLPVSLL